MSEKKKINDQLKKYSIYESIIKKLKLKVIAQTEEKEDFNIKIKSEKNEILEYKILIIGDRCTGKTSFCLRFALNEFNLEIKSSNQSECFLKTILLLDKEIKVYLIDVINTMNNFNEELLKNVKGVIAIYDITKLKSFETAEKLIKEIRQKIGNIVPILLLGNKNDLKFLRDIDYEDAVEKANNLNCLIKEINCVDEDSVHHTIKYLIAKIFFNDLDENEKENLKKILKE
jgi:small GTP-binding protein